MVKLRGGQFRAAKQLSTAFLLGLSLFGCEGNIVGKGASGTEALPPGAVVDGGPGAQASGSCSGSAALPGAMYLRRLTNQEFGATLRELFGVESSVAALPPDLTLYGFDNNAETISLSTAHLEAYRGIIEKAASDLVASTERRTALLGCDPAGADRTTCLTGFVRRFGAKAFRRPLSDVEVSDLTQRATTAAPTAEPWTAVVYAVESLLQSPSFLFRVELGEADPARAGLRRLTGYEMATRLSYLLWGSMPNDALFDAAASGKLGTAEGVEAQALAMLEDKTKALPTTWSFAGQWLRMGSLAAVDRPAANYPLFDEAVRAAMAEETRRLVEDNVSRPGAPLLDLLDTQTTFVNAKLAPLYGVTPPPGDTWAQLTLPAEQGRRGILTQASVLTLTGSVHATTPILRGRYLRQVLLCDDLPPPPPDVPALPEAQQGMGERERLAAHRANPACSGCHDMLEPLGFGLSGFDAIGKYRTTDDQGVAIDTHGVINGLDDATFEGPAGLAERLRHEPRVGKCLSTHLVRFALGRKEADSESCTITQLGDVLQQGGDYRSVLRALVKSDAFRYRLPSDAAPGAMP